MAPDDALAQMREAGDGFLAALGLGYLGGIWRLDPEDQLLAREEHAAALAALATETARLAEREQKLFRLRYTEAMSWPEVAEHFGVSESTVERWHSSALRRLAKRLKERGVEGAPRPLDTG
jgi:RNA polymerase sigma factor (sigma-70 family)